MLKNHTFYLVLCCFLVLGSHCVLAEDKNQQEVGNTVSVETTITAVSAADLEISDKRVSKTVTWTLNFLSGTDLEQRKANLIIELCRTVGADVLVDPQFTFSKRMFGGGKLTVSGYPATYKNFRSMTDKQIDAFVATPEYNTGKVVFINK